MYDTIDKVFDALSSEDADVVWECVYALSRALSEHPGLAKELENSRERFDCVVALEKLGRDDDLLEGGFSRGHDLPYFDEFEGDDDRALAHMFFWLTLRQEIWSTPSYLDRCYRELLYSLCQDESLESRVQRMWLSNRQVASLVLDTLVIN